MAQNPRKADWPKLLRHERFLDHSGLAGWLRHAWVMVLMVWSVIGVLSLILVAFRVGGSPAVTPQFLAMLGLWYCTFCYLLNRLGAERRLRRPEPRSTLPETGPAPHVSILIPSYCEEPEVIELTLLSAALMRYRRRDIVVLIDDPLSDMASVQRSEAAVGGVRDTLDRAQIALTRARSGWQDRRSRGVVDIAAEQRGLAHLLHGLADWYDALGQSRLADAKPRMDHIERHFVEQVTGPLAREARNRAHRVAALTSLDGIDQAYEALAGLICADISTFQRKRFANLSHAANKAMNLNAYIGLMGSGFDIAGAPGAETLIASDGPAPALRVIRPDYVMTLDADSVVSPDYLRELVPILMTDDRAAVAQTPYLSFPDAPNPVERISGATTDIQYLAHQGSSAFRASFWVGANALLRHAALEDIKVMQKEGAQEVPVFVQDRTVIEDTGSTIDLLSRGWLVHNHFRPLAFSATPADFGALCIQRKRWSNGGLIIVASLVAATFRKTSAGQSPWAFLLRAYYLLSPVIGNVSILLLMFSPLPDTTLIAAMVVAVLPYFALYAFDLSRIGYRASDVFRVVALNLVLLPVAIAGVLESAVQILTGRKANFVRTPKIAGRTLVPPVFTLFFAGILFTLSALFVRAWQGQQLDPVTAVAIVVNLSLFSIGIVRYVGLREALSDLWWQLYAPVVDSTARFRAPAPAVAAQEVQAYLPGEPKRIFARHPQDSIANRADHPRAAIQARTRH